MNTQNHNAGLTREKLIQTQQSKHYQRSTLENTSDRNGDGKPHQNKYKEINLLEKKKSVIPKQ